MTSLETIPFNLSLARYKPGEKFEAGITALCERHPPVDRYLVARRILKVSAAIISASAKAPFAPISLKLGPILGPISVVGNSTGFFVLEYWAVTKTIDDFFEPRTQGEIELFRAEKLGKRKICRNIVIITFSSLIALASQITTALPGAAYNEKNFKMLAAVVLLISGSLIPIRSLQLSIEHLRLSCQRTTEAEITKIKEKMVALLTANQQMFVQKSHDGKVEFIQECNETRTFDASPTEKTGRYILTLLQNVDAPVNRAKKVTRTVFNYTGLAAGVFLAGVFEYASGDYTFHTTKTELMDNDYLGVALATLAVGSTAYLFATSIVRTTQRIFNAVGNIITGREPRNLGWQLRPKLSFALTAIGLLTDVCALGPSYVIWGDFYKNNEIEHEFFQKTMCASLFLLLFTSILDIVNDMVTYSIVKGSEEERQILQLSEEFQKLASLIGKSPSRELIGYLTDMEEPAKASLLAKLNVGAGQLTVYAEKLGF